MTECKNLITLDLKGDPIGTGIEIVDYPHLRYLSLTDLETVPDGITIENCPELEEFHCYKNHDIWKIELKDCPLLKTLELALSNNYSNYNLSGLCYLNLKNLPLLTGDKSNLEKFVAQLPERYASAPGTIHLTDVSNFVDITSWIGGVCEEKNWLLTTN